MKDFINKTSRNLSFEEHRALLNAGEILAKGFKKKLHQVVINPNAQEASDVWGIAYAFDMNY